MRSALARHGSTIVIAVLVSALTAAAPSIAAGVRATFASDSDKVDGIHAATAAQAKRPALRKGRLIATNPKTGLLPSLVIPTVANSERLGGRTAEEFLGSGAGVVTSTQLADGAVGGAKIANNAVTGAQVDESSLSQVPDAAKLGGFPREQIGTTKVMRIPTTTLASPVITVVDVAVPVDGIVTIYASCEFRNTGAAAQTVNLFTRRQDPSGTPNTNLNHRGVVPAGGAPFPNETFVMVAAVDYFTATAGSVFQYGVRVDGSANTACQNGRLIVTYSATTTEIA